ncbi:hypothetical protein BDV09DRAFT_188498 [Aspergillus tetrazonus]
MWRLTGSRNGYFGGPIKRLLTNSVGPVRSHASDLPHPQIHLPRKEQFLKDFKHALNTMQPYSEWLLLTSVTNEIFHAEFLESEEHPFSNVSSYNKQLEILLLRMDVSKPHEAAVHGFGLLLNAVSRHRVKLRVYGGYHSATDWGKIPDEAWRPLQLPKDRSLDWPSIVLEVSFSETREKLMSDIRHWLGASGGDVKVWAMKDGREGREQRIEITKSGPKVEVSEDALELSFERIFLCPPSTDGEATIPVHAPVLKSFAEAIWEQQEFISVQRI